MRHLLFAFGRLLLISASAFGLSTVANYYNHKGYWEGTIARVQTTDFNLLSHTMPTKLSYALMKGDRAEIQRTLNSNYGLFGIVVTNCTSTELNCSEQQIMYATESNLSWRKQLRAERLAGMPYNYLQNPPPLMAEGGYDTSRSTTWNGSTVRNPGGVFGRVYYVRGIPPRFWTTYTSWFKQLPGSLLSDSGAQKYYALTLVLFSLGGFSGWRLIEWLYAQKRLQQRLFAEEKQQTQREVDLLQQELQEQLNQVSALIVERQQFVAQLARHQQAQEKQAEQLKQVVSQYETGLRHQPQDNQPQNTDANVQVLRQLFCSESKQLLGLAWIIHEASR